MNLCRREWYGQEMTRKRTLSPSSGRPNNDGQSLIVIANDGSDPKLRQNSCPPGRPHKR